jgi:hypothetical protein
MRDFVILLVHVNVTICRLWRPNGARSVIAESILLKQQLLINTYQALTAFCRRHDIGQAEKKPAGQYSFAAVNLELV